MEYSHASWKLHKTRAIIIASYAIALELIYINTRIIFPEIDNTLHNSHFVFNVFLTIFITASIWRKCPNRSSAGILIHAILSTLDNFHFQPSPSSVVSSSTKFSCSYKRGRHNYIIEKYATKLPKWHLTPDDLATPLIWTLCNCNLVAYFTII